jgi:hypothetical protein
MTARIKKPGGPTPNQYQTGEHTGVVAVPLAVPCQHVNDWPVLSKTSPSPLPTPSIASRATSPYSPIFHPLPLLVPRTTVSHSHHLAAHWCFVTYIVKRTTLPHRLATALRGGEEAHGPVLSIRTRSAVPTISLPTPMQGDAGLVNALSPRVGSKPRLIKRLVLTVFLRNQSSSCLSPFVFSFSWPIEPSVTVLALLDCDSLIVAAPAATATRATTLHGPASIQ